MNEPIKHVEYLTVSGRPLFTAVGVSAVCLRMFAGHF